MKNLNNRNLPTNIAFFAPLVPYIPYAATAIASGAVAVFAKKSMTNDGDGWDVTRFANRDLFLAGASCTPWGASVRLVDVASDLVNHQSTITQTESDSSSANATSSTTDGVSSSTASGTAGSAPQKGSRNVRKVLTRIAGIIGGILLLGLELIQATGALGVAVITYLISLLIASIKKLHDEKKRESEDNDDTQHSKDKSIAASYSDLEMGVATSKVSDYQPVVALT